MKGKNKWSDPLNCDCLREASSCDFQVAIYGLDGRIIFVYILCSDAVTATTSFSSRERSVDFFSHKDWYSYFQCGSECKSKGVISMGTRSIAVTLTTRLPWCWNPLFRARSIRLESFWGCEGGCQMGLRCRPSRQIWQYVMYCIQCQCTSNLKCPWDHNKRKVCAADCPLNYLKLKQEMRFGDLATRSTLFCPWSSTSRYLNPPSPMEVAEELRKKFRRYLAQGTLHEQFLGRSSCWSCEATGSSTGFSQGLCWFIVWFTVKSTT